MDFELKSKLLPSSAKGIAHANPVASRLTRIGISTVTQQCIVLFKRSCTSKSLVNSDIENQIGRFKIWCGTIGVFAGGKASTEYRLRNDEDIKDLMIDLLVRLRNSLERFMNPVIIEEESDDETASLDSSDESLVISIGDDSSSSAVQSKASNQHASCIEEIDIIISKLYRLAAIIRKPISLHENARVASFIERVEDLPDSTEFESHVRWQIEFRLPDASKTMVDRLVSAVQFRRRKLRYRQRHQDKLSQGLETAFKMEVVLPSTGLQVNKIRSQRPVSRFLKSPETSSLSGSIPLSETVASAVNRKSLASYAKSVAGGSNITRSAIARRDQLDVPPPPKIDETKEALCPYCFEVVEKANMVQPMWTRHILKDIEPYVCLFDECSRPNEQYQSYDDWMTHMTWYHTLVWICPTPRHANLKFDTSAECEAHIREEHGDDISMTQISVVVEKSARPAADPLDVITRIDESGKLARCVCPFCSFSADRTNISDIMNDTNDSATLAVSPKEMRDHIVAHLEFIALLSLPEQDELENAASDEVQSESAKASTRIAEQMQESSFWEDISSDSRQELKEDEPKILTGSDYEHWNSITAIIRDRSPPVDLMHDQVLIPFITRARRLQSLELQKRLGIPLIIVTDPQGLEVLNYQMDESSNLL